MASLDFVYDLTEKFDKDGMEYIVVCLQKADDAMNAYVFHNVKSNKTLNVMSDSINKAFTAEAPKPRKRKKK